jgi:hypothetical protein
MTTTTKTTTKASPRTRTVALPAGFELRSENGSWLLYGYASAPIALDRTQAITVAISEKSGLPFLLVPLAGVNAVQILPFTALAPLRRVFPAWTVEADESTWVRIFEIEAFIGALRIS